LVNEDLERLITRSHQELLGFMDTQEPDADDYKRARAVQGIYASATRELQTRGAQEATAVAIAMHVLETPEDRMQWLRVTDPMHPAIRAKDMKALPNA